jgi:hypothetical protein
MTVINAINATKRGLKGPIRHCVPLVLMLSMACATVCFGNRTVRIRPFSSMAPAKEIGAPWQALTFPGINRHTQYHVVRVEGRSVIWAHSTNSASGLIHNIEFKPDDYPWLHWRWRVQGVLENGNVTVKQGDDCSARLYVAFAFVPAGKTMWERIGHRAACIAAGRPLPGSALTYIWANKAARGTIIDSPYTAQSKMVVVESGPSLASRWIDEQRNIKEDYHAAYGQAPPPVMGIAIMTDTDNTGASATAFFGDIRIEKFE